MLWQCIAIKIPRNCATKSEAPSRKGRLHRKCDDPQVQADLTARCPRLRHWSPVSLGLTVVIILQIASMACEFLLLERRRSLFGAKLKLRAEIDLPVLIRV